MAEPFRGLWEREFECARIAGAVKGAAQGRGGVLLVRGPAGIGKTALLAEARAQAVEAGAIVARARGVELEVGFAFGIVNQLFEPLLAAADAEARERLWAGPAGQARSTFAAVGQPSESSADGVGDFAVLHGLYWLTLNACQDRPLVLVVDDLQWCDVPSLRFLAFLLPRLEDSAVLLAGAIRTGEPAADPQLLERINADPAAQVLEPSPLSAQGTGDLLGQVLPPEVDPVFAASCHAASGGNPLLVRELARTLTTKDIAPTAANAARVTDLGGLAVAWLVQTRLDRLPPAATALARAVAVLGDRVDWARAADLAACLVEPGGREIGAGEVLQAGATLEKVEILRFTQRTEAGLPPLVSLVHPLVRAAVYGTLDQAGQTAAHAQAAQLLAATGADPERIAAHLLHTMPAGNQTAVEQLRAAAEGASRRGAPGNAYGYLRRALAEPPDPGLYQQVLLAAGYAAAMGVDPHAAVSHLQQAYDQATDPIQAATISIPLGTACLYQMEFERALDVWTEALDRLPRDQRQDLRYQLESEILAAATWFVPGRPDILGLLDELRNAPFAGGPGAVLLQSAIANRETAIGDPAGIGRARRVAASTEAGQYATNGNAWRSLIAADDTDVLDASLQAADDWAHARGSLFGQSYLSGYSGIRGLCRGQLAQAEQDLREAIRSSTALVGSASAISYLTAPYLAETLTELGRLAEAEQTLRDVGISPPYDLRGPAYLGLAALAGMELARGDRQAALAAALRAEAVCRRFDIRNPARVGWRSHAALALHALDRADEAREIAAEDLRLSRTWGAPRALGRALRISGLITGGEKGLRLLQQAIDTLADSPARLEYAKALADLGAALRRAGHRVDARDPLRQALDLAVRCGATPLAATTRTELAAAGGRPRHTAVTGPDSLTPSERRVADLAAEGATNRQIAQSLYITPKTVEVHLSAAYRKLEITTRTQLEAALGPIASRQ
jgi:DNA-binding CsgD family transcriptional regulator/tetratricopeptide (TPR) repeat protein